MKKAFFSLFHQIQLFQSLRYYYKKKYPQLSEINSYAIAINESYAVNETILKENDLIAIIPPVSGG